MTNVLVPHCRNCKTSRRFFHSFDARVTLKEIYNDEMEVNDSMYNLFDDAEETWQCAACGSKRVVLREVEDTGELLDVESPRGLRLVKAATA